MGSRGAARGSEGQSAVEYAIAVAVVMIGVAALSGMWTDWRTHGWAATAANVPAPYTPSDIGKEMTWLTDLLAH